MSSVLKQHPSAGSFYVISRPRVQRQLFTWKSLMPEIKPYYAVKCNPEPQLIKWLAPEAGFDCASAREIQIVKELAPKSDIVFANPCKKEDDIYYAMKQGVKTTVVDSYEEVDKLYHCRWGGNSFIRIRVDDSGSKMRFGEKFGASMKDAANLAKYAESKGQEISGVSFHVGSGCAAPSQYTRAIAQANSLLNTDPKAKTIDIGGGFTDTHIEAASKAVALGKELLADDVRLIAEPGRFFAETSHDLFVKVIGKKPSANGKGFRYTIDESLYGQFSCIPFDHAQPRWIRISYGNHKRGNNPAILYGRTCDSVDMIASAQEAEELCEGDWLWFPNMGAYTTVTSTEFNGFPKPPLIILDKYAEEELPPTQSFTQSEWPSGLQYVSAVTCPTFS